MERAEALIILNLTPEPSDGSWRYSWPTGQIVLAARRALRPRVPCFDQADLAAQAFLVLADKMAAQECLTRTNGRAHNARETRRVK